MKSKPISDKGISANAIDSKIQKKRRGRGIPFAEWPALDQAAWSRALHATGLFEKHAPLAGLSASTIDARRYSYGVYLAHLTSLGALNHDQVPGARPNPENIKSYIDTLWQRLRASAIEETVESLISVLRIFSPERDWSWIRRLSNFPTSAQISSSAKPIDPPDQVGVLKEALDQFDEATAKAPCVAASLDVRDALIVIFFVLFAIRSENMAEIRRGVHFREEFSRFRLMFLNPLKGGIPVLFDIPSWLEPRLKIYLEKHRITLLGGKHDHGGLWICRGGAKFSTTTIKHIIKKFGQNRLHRPLISHVFRHAMGTVIVLKKSSDNVLAAAALGHTTTMMVDKVYTKSANIQFSRKYQNIIKDRRRKLGLN
ncbi:tyrosine-type recombinase/integrase [Acidocella aquatica]|uniref:tyrosine-type recombinase/integrase n=1 Tax=Acidocella aquatica TaxID=1922313 RepID=UPI0024E1463F|nr:tyrosine-type recombinase/integrase [Acidocella aquatica]